MSSPALRIYIQFPAFGFTLFLQRFVLQAELNVFFDQLFFCILFVFHDPSLYDAKPSAEQVESGIVGRVEWFYRKRGSHYDEKGRMLSGGERLPCVG